MYLFKGNNKKGLQLPFLTFDKQAAKKKNDRK